MTTTTRAIETIEAAIETARDMIERVGQHLVDLRSTPRAPTYVVGFPQYGFWLHEDQEGLASNILAARQFSDAGTAYRLDVRNGMGEVAQVIRRDSALDMAIGQQEDLHTSLCGMMADLYNELDADARQDR